MRRIMMVALLGASAVSLGQATQPAGVDLKDPSAARELVAKLSDDTLAEREQGQRKLEAVPVGSLEVLRGLADSTDNAEARARMLRRLDALDDIHALNPKMISVHVKDAPLSRVAEELSRQTGATILGAAGNETYSLDAEGVSFMEIVQRLGAQDAIVDVDVNGGLTLKRAPDDPKWSVIDRGAIAVVNPTTLSPRGMNNTLEIPMMVFADPRSQLLMVEATGLTIVPETTDAHLSQSRPLVTTVLAHNGMTQWMQPVVLGNKKEDVGKLVRISGVMELTVALEMQTVTVDPAKDLKRNIACGENVANIGELSTTPLGQGQGMMRMAYQIGGSDGILPPPHVGNGTTTESRPPDPLDRPLMPGVSMAFVDAKGNEIIVQHVAPRTSISVRREVQAAFVEPLKVVLKAPTKIRVVKVPFDFRNVTVSW